MNNKGFTLIELMVVIIILGILMGYVGYQFMGAPDEARYNQANIQIQALEDALKMYRLDNGDYPSTEQGLKALVEKPTAGNVPRKWRKNGYLDSSSVPKDPWANDYVYLYPGIRNSNKFDIMSYAADGQPGGDEWDKDIGNWEGDDRK